MITFYFWNIGSSDNDAFEFLCSFGLLSPLGHYFHNIFLCLSVDFVNEFYRAFSFLFAFLNYQLYNYETINLPFLFLEFLQAADLTAKTSLFSSFQAFEIFASGDSSQISAARKNGRTHKSETARTRLIIECLVYTRTTTFEYSESSAITTYVREKRLVYVSRVRQKIVTIEKTKLTPYVKQPFYVSEFNIFQKFLKENKII